MSVTSSRKRNAEKWLIAARSERQVLRFVEQSLIGYDDTYKKYIDTVWPSDSPSKQLPKDTMVLMRGPISYILQSSHVDATADDNTFTASGYVSPDEPSVRKGYVSPDEPSVRKGSRMESLVVAEHTTWRSLQTGSIRPCQPLQIASTLPAEGGAPVNPFTQGAAAGHAGAPQAGPPVATAPQPGAEDGIAAVIRRGSSSRKSSSLEARHQHKPP
ncbi:hypothetical protein D6D12_07680 [Aureobasidium pullulans]|uniref:Uncharacterized protein n=1 Tax=Aureobasidium pullulans TaxID=5580 RepID=A0AB74JKH9_AURPU|nr:hypothetical protein D6D12_07680 [Aureobasidium pullulans]THX53531.1 hypothetical protein D6D11_04426 [Aureobasidium pullulans]